MLQNRFLSIFLLAFAAGIAAALLAGDGGKAVCLLVFAGMLLLVAVGVGLLVRAGRLDIWVGLYPLLLAMGLTFGAGYLCLRSLPHAEYELLTGLSDHISGTVTDSGTSADSAWLTLRVEQGRMQLPDRTEVRVFCTDAPTVRVGDRVSASVVYRRLASAVEQGDGVDLLAYGSVTSVRGGISILASIRRAVVRACNVLYTPYGVAGTAQALTVRERSALSGKTAADYRNAGLSHLLAISGLHLSILVLALRRMLAWLHLPKKPRECLALLLLVLYCVLTGFSPSVVRASVMLGFSMVGEMTLRRFDSLTTLFVALGILLLANPYALLSAGLQLSFLSCLGILLVSPMARELEIRIFSRRLARFPRLRMGLGSMIGSLVISCTAVLCTFPVTVFRFGTVAYLSPLINLAVLPVFEPLLALLLLSVLLQAAGFPLARLIALLPGHALAWLERGLALLSAWNVGSAALSGWQMWVPAGISMGSIGALLVCPRRGFRMSVVLFGAFALVLAGILLFVR